MVWAVRLWAKLIPRGRAGADTTNASATPPALGVSYKPHRDGDSWHRGVSLRGAFVKLPAPWVGFWVPVA
jgi:hypothetical protein